MKKIVFIVVLLIIAVIAIIFGLSYYVQNKSLNALKSTGLTIHTIDSIEKTFGVIRFENIALDQDNISTLERYQTSLTEKNRLFANVDNLKLVGEWNDNTVQISGFNALNFPFTLADLPIQTVYFKNSSLALLTPVLGGVTLNADGQLTHLKGGVEIQSRMTSDQKNLSLNASLSGTITRSDWTIEGEIDQTKINWPPYHAYLSRAHGTFSANQSRSDNWQYFAQINAGGLSLFETPWQNCALTLERRGEYDRIFLTANGIDNEAMELNITKAGSLVEATVYAPDGETLVSFLEKYGHTDIVTNINATRRIKTPLTLEINADIDTGRMNAEIKQN
jgi:hypothetical protein